MGEVERIREDTNAFKYPVKYFQKEDESWECDPPASGYQSSLLWDAGVKTSWKAQTSRASG